jgi:hypothetical protein
MNRFVLLLIAGLLSACGNADSSPSSGKPDSVTYSIHYTKQVKDSSLIDTVALGIVFVPEGDYAVSRQKLEKQRIVFKNRYKELIDTSEKKALLDSAGRFLTNALINTIVPHWYGMVWDFNGYSETPGKGTVACGYFVSTTLKHAGFNINRFKMAQQAGYHEALTLQDDSLLTIIDNQYGIGNKEICNRLKPLLKDGLYFIGLTCHVGYLYVKGGELYFLHSNYISGYVMIEKAEYSQAFTSSIYVIADITHNPVLIEKWIKGDEVVVITN